jgi:prolipoprotein diacylglyceryltransferase
VTLAQIRLDFDPVVELLGFAVRWQALGVAAAVLVALLLASLRARDVRRDTSVLRPLRRDDLLYIAVAALPGAVVGGRIVHGLTFADVYAADPAALLDPARGSLSLLGAVVGGIVTGGYVARLLDGFAGRWADIASVPLLVAIALGKLAQALGGGGQGAPFDGAWSTLFVGAGPWLSTEPGSPAHPSQVYEAIWALVGVGVLVLLGRPAVVERLPHALRQSGGWVERRRDRLEELVPGDLRFGTRLVLALAWFCVGRVLIGFTWREEPLVVGLRTEQIAALVVLLAIVLRAVLAALLDPGREGREERWRLSHRRYRVPD